MYILTELVHVLLSYVAIYIVFKGGFKGRGSGSHAPLPFEILPLPKRTYRRAAPASVE